MSSRVRKNIESWKSSYEKSQNHRHARIEERVIKPCAWEETKSAIIRTFAILMSALHAKSHIRNRLERNNHHTRIMLLGINVHISPSNFVNIRLPRLYHQPKLSSKYSIPKHPRLRAACTATLASSAIAGGPQTNTATVSPFVSALVAAFEIAAVMSGLPN